MCGTSNRGEGEELTSKAQRATPQGSEQVSAIIVDLIENSRVRRGYELFADCVLESRLAVRSGLCMFDLRKVFPVFSLLGRISFVAPK